MIPYQNDNRWNGRKSDLRHHKNLVLNVQVEKEWLACFWGCDRIIYIDWFPEGQTINSQYYCKILTELREAIKINRRGKLTRGVLLQHDNARPHTSGQTLRTIRDLNYDVLPHPPYSPDLAPSDYYLFGEMAKVTRGKRYTNIQEMIGELGRWAKGVYKSWFHFGIQQLEAGWTRCIERKGDYVETTD